MQMLLSFLLRPAPEHWLRRPWNLVHWWWGRLVMLVAFGNFFYGLWMVNSSLPYYIVPGAILAAFLIASALKVRLPFFPPVHSAADNAIASLQWSLQADIQLAA